MERMGRWMTLCIRAPKDGYGYMEKLDGEWDRKQMHYIKTKPKYYLMVDRITRNPITYILYYI
jgi:hypothetical protein